MTVSKDKIGFIANVEGDVEILSQEKKVNNILYINKSSGDNEILKGTINITSYL